MDVIRDVRGRVVCKGDPCIGLIETRYCKFVVRTVLGKGESISIEREGTITKTISQRRKSGKRIAGRTYRGVRAHYPL